MKGSVKTAEARLNAAEKRHSKIRKLLSVRVPLPKYLHSHTVTRSHSQTATGSHMLYVLHYLLFHRRAPALPPYPHKFSPCCQHLHVLFIWCCISSFGYGLVSGATARIGRLCGVAHIRSCLVGDSLCCLACFIPRPSPSCSLAAVARAVSVLKCRLLHAFMA
jgi:hypothetical protein